MATRPPRCGHETCRVEQRNTALRTRTEWTIYAPSLFVSPSPSLVPLRLLVLFWPQNLDSQSMASSRSAPCSLWITKARICFLGLPIIASLDSTTCCCIWTIVMAQQGRGIGASSNRLWDYIGSGLSASVRLGPSRTWKCSVTVRLLPEGLAQPGLSIGTSVCRSGNQALDR